MTVTAPASLAQWLVALSVDVEQQRLVGPYRIGFVVRAGILTDLLHLGALDGGCTPTGRPVQDPVLEWSRQRIAAKPGTGWWWWLHADRQISVSAVLDQLEQAGALAVAPGPRPWSGRRWQLANPAGVAATGVQVGRAVTGPEPVAAVPPYLAVLAGLACAGRVRTVQPDALSRLRLHGRYAELRAAAGPPAETLHRILHPRKAGPPLMPGLPSPAP